MTTVIGDGRVSGNLVGMADSMATVRETGAMTDPVRTHSRTADATIDEARVAPAWSNATVALVATPITARAATTPGSSSLSTDLRVSSKVSVRSM